MSTTTSSKKNHWFQFLVPMILCLLFVLGLVGYRQYKIMIAQTRIQFSVVPPESRSALGIVMQLDNNPVTVGQQISLGSHTLSISSPKIETFHTNFFAWLGAKDLGQIKLKRAIGKLFIASAPPTSSVMVDGPDFSTVIRDVSKTNLSVPADAYRITAHYPHWSQTQNINVSDQSLAACTFTPSFGAIKVTCNYDQTTFELADDSGNVVERGELPKVVTGLLPGVYQLKAILHNNEQTMTVSVKSDMTNNEAFDFEFGAVQISSSPMGAYVRDATGRLLGQTPLLLAEQQPQPLQFQLQLAGYEPAIINATVVANQTNNFETNLVSYAFERGIKTASDYLAAGKYAQADTAVKTALKMMPENADAQALQHRILGLWLVQLAKNSAKAGDYVSASADLKKSLTQLPDYAESKSLLAQYQAQIPQQLAEEKEQRLKAPKVVFDQEASISPDSVLFASHELKTTKPWSEVESAIVKAFETGDPAFKITRHNSGQPEVFDLEARQEFWTYLKTSAGYRQVMIVGGQITDKETEIFYKVCEYKSEAAIKFSIGNLIGTPVAVNYVPLNSLRMKMTDDLKNRVTEGVEIATRRIKDAIGQN